MILQPGSERAAAEVMRRLPEVRSAGLAMGQQDLITLVEAASFEAVLAVVASRARVLDGVKNTLTNFILG